MVFFHPTTKKCNYLLFLENVNVNNCLSNNDKVKKKGNTRCFRGGCGGLNEHKLNEVEGSE
jgi:hypothetical protein